MVEQPFDPIIDYTQTQRIVLLIDLHSLLHLPNPTHYTKPILSSIKTLLSVPPFSSSSTLTTFKLFFSSLSPLLSSSKLQPFTQSSQLSLSFHHPTTTLHSLSRTLNSLPNFNAESGTLLLRSHASHVAAAMRQLVHGYAWDSEIDDPGCAGIVRSNLVVLFSPLCEGLKGLGDFFDLGIGDDESLGNVGAFCERFCGVFGSVRDAFRSWDIHCSWVGVGCGFDSSSESEEFRNVYRLFENGIKRLDWGLCSVYSIVLGSALVPFGLIYPKIGISWGSIGVSDCSRKVQVDLSLLMLDVNGNPIECNCCNLELIDLKILGDYGNAWFSSALMNSRNGRCEKDKFWKQFERGITKFQIKAVKRCDAFVDLWECLSDSILMVEGSREWKKQHNVNLNEFFVDRVLGILAAEFGSVLQRKSVPIWQMLLSFLYREGCWALVSVTNDNGGSCFGILRPFTVYSALFSALSITDVACESDGAIMAKYIRTMDADICKPESKFKDQQKKKMMDLNTIKNLTWSTFCDAVYDQFEIDLNEVYCAMDCNKSKKLKFLKCWMKQMKKLGFSGLTSSEKFKPNQITPEENKGRLTESPENDEHPISSSASAGTTTEASRMEDDTVIDFRTETSEAFFSNLSEKIHQGIESEVIDLAALAERLVSSSIYWLSQKLDKETIPKTQSPLNSQEACSSFSMVASELIKLLLIKPKKLAAKHKRQNASSQDSDTGAATLITEHVVREYELQIFFRMEILKSEVGNGVEESSKQKFIKQICLLLENIQRHMEEGFFGDWIFENYVAYIINSRYSCNLGDVVRKIYDKMDLLPFTDEDETPNYYVNSEGSNKSCKEKPDQWEFGENDVSIGPLSAESEPFRLSKIDSQKRLQSTEERDHEQRLIEAKERREKAKRLSSFTSWIPDLHRVWAPRHKGMKQKSDSNRMIRERKDQQRPRYDVVSETPMTGNKGSSWQMMEDAKDDSYMVRMSQSCGSVSKLLFHD